MDAASSTRSVEASSRTHFTGIDICSRLSGGFPPALSAEEASEAANAPPVDAPCPPVRRRAAAAACRYFRRGYCWYGANCHFQHSGAPSGGSGGEPVVALCRYFRQGNCKKGSSCRFRHDLVGRECMMPKIMSRMEDDEDEDDEDEDDELEQRMQNGGFTDAEMNELLCQGVKPWDDDAWDVLAALNSMEI